MTTIEDYSKELLEHRPCSIMKEMLRKETDLVLNLYRDGHITRDSACIRLRDKFNEFSISIDKYDELPVCKKSINVKTNPTSSKLGVSWLSRESRWTATIYDGFHCITVYMGRFLNEDDAIYAREDAEKLYADYRALETHDQLFKDYLAEHQDARVRRLRTRPSPGRANTSGTKGVTFDKRGGKWTAILKIDGKPKFIGAFLLKKDAVKAMKDARKNLLTNQKR